MTDPRTNTVNEDANQDGPSRPLRRIKFEGTQPAVPHSVIPTVLWAIGLLSIACGLALLVVGLFARQADAAIGVGVQGVIAGVTLFAFSIIVRGVEEIAYWTRRAAESLERRP